jgi:hypothetical protein
MEPQHMKLHIKARLDLPRIKRSAEHELNA